MRGQRFVRMLLVILEIGQHPGAHPVEQCLPGLRRRVGGFEQLRGAGADDLGEERPLVGKVVVHQSP